MQFSEKFNERSHEEKIEYLGKLCASQNSALDQMQKERNKWMEKCKFLDSQLHNAEKAFEIQKTINHDLMTLQNSDQQTMNRDVEKMVAYIGELGGNINRMGD